MVHIKIRVSDSAKDVFRAGEAFLHGMPVQNNLVLTILNERVSHPEPGRYWTVWADGRFAGLALQSPPTVPGVLTEIPSDCIEDLATAMAADRPALLGILEEAATASKFAGCWAERLNIPVSPVEALRLCRLKNLRPPPTTPGSLRTANSADFDLIIEWLQGFQRDTGGTVAPPDTLRRRVEAGLISIWEDGKPVSMASISMPLAQTVRIGHVYTPPEHRGRGYAASCVASLSLALLNTGILHCVLYTQLSNPQSNAIYRHLGYEPVAEHVCYKFG